MNVDVSRHEDLLTSTFLYGLTIHDVSSLTLKSKSNKIVAALAAPDTKTTFMIHDALDLIITLPSQTDSILTY